MRPDEFPAGTKLGWTLVGVVVVGLVVVGISIEVSTQRFRRKTEALGQRLISDFHEQYNSHIPGLDSGAAIPEFIAIESNRPKLGKFYTVQSCQITAYIEPSTLLANCTSVFERGKAQENFAFRYSSEDHRLTSYKAALLDSDQ